VTRSPDESSRVRLAPVADPGRPVELAPGSTAADAGTIPPASCGPVPGTALPGTAAPSLDPSGDGAAQSPLPGATPPRAPESGTTGLSGQDARDKWREALSARAKGQRNQRGRRPKPKGFQVGAARLRPAEETFSEAPLPSLRLKAPEPPPDAA